MAVLQLVLLFLATVCIHVQGNQQTCDVKAIVQELKAELTTGDTQEGTSQLEQKLDELDKKYTQPQVGQCECNSTYYRPANCAVIYKQGARRDGVYTIYPENKDGIRVFCDMTTDGGGWTVFQKRYNGAVDFYRNWESYARGFGNPEGEYWLGLRRIHALTGAQPQELYVRLTVFNDGEKYAKYRQFKVLSEDQKFRLSVGRYSGSAGDSLIDHNRMMFSTYDRDNDKATNYNCSQQKHGAWWYKACFRSNLNGRYYAKKQKANPAAMTWYTLRNSWESVAGSVMQLRPVLFKR